MVYGKLPPQARDLEEAVLGAIMLERTAFDSVTQFLRAEHFYVDAHQKIFESFQDLNKKSLPIDALTVVEQLKVNEELENVGGPYYVTKLTNAVVSTANLEAHSRIIMQKFIVREIIRIGGEHIGDAYEDSIDCFELLDKVEQDIYNLSNSFFTTDFKDMPDGLFKFTESLDHKIAHNDKLTGVPSGFKEIDECTNGWQATDLIILAARPSVGKTALALNLAVSAASDKIKPTAVGIFCLEMSIHQLMERIVCADTKISLSKIRRGKIDETERKIINKTIKKLEQMPLYIDDTSTLTWMDVRSKARRLVLKRKVGLIIIDYLQLMSDVNDGTKKNREQQISNISRELKKLAKELNIPIIALSQLSRQLETRGVKDRVPQLSDLRDSGAIEQDADVVAFIYRPEGLDSKKEIGETFVKISKHRNGTLETIKLISKLHIQKFYSKEDPEINAGLPLNERGWQGPVTVKNQDGEEDPNFKF